MNRSMVNGMLKFEKAAPKTTSNGILLIFIFSNKKNISKISPATSSIGTL